MIPFGSRPLAAASCAMLTPARAAIADSVSPGWTRYPREPEELTPLDVMPAELDGAALELTGPATPAELDCGGIRSVVPEVSWEEGEMPFAAASSATVTPSAAATELSDSPGVTVWGKAADAAAGETSIAAAKIEQ